MMARALQRVLEAPDAVVQILDSITQSMVVTAYMPIETRSISRTGPSASWLDRKK